MGAAARTTLTALVLPGLLVAAEGCSRKAQPPRVTINDKAWYVDLAVTDTQRQHGLAGRDYLADDVGMLFVFPDADERRFWMEGCAIDLDIAFIGPDLSVLSMYTMKAEPDRRGHQLYYSGGPAKYALEVAAGSLRRTGVKKGDKVILSGDIPEAK